MMRAALFSTKDRRHADFYPPFCLLPFYFACARRNAATHPGIKNAHKARRESSGNFERFAFYLQVDAGKGV
jgi:hypothetical protein